PGNRIPAQRCPASGRMKGMCSAERLPVDGSSGPSGSEGLLRLSCCTYLKHVGVDREAPYLAVRLVVGDYLGVTATDPPATACIGIRCSQGAVLLHDHQVVFLDVDVVQVTQVRVAVFGTAKDVA